MNCRVLIVDDSPILRAAIRKVVRLAGIDNANIDDAGDGREALIRLEAAPADLVLLDINMPVMNGEEFVEALRARPDMADTRVVIVSTESNRARLDHLRRLGVTDRLQKPFEPEDLAAIVQQNLRAA
ncbi:MAG: response regulator [Phycisphaerales bacterium]